MQDRITLIEVKQAFEQWRAGKLHSRERAPKSLQAQVKAIAAYYPREQIIKELVINQAQMNRYVSRNKVTESISIPVEVPSNEFIELPMPVLLKPKPGLVLTITRCDSSSWTISEATQDVISESLHLFLRG